MRKIIAMFCAMALAVNVLGAHREQIAGATEKSVKSKVANLQPVNSVSRAADAAVDRDWVDLDEDCIMVDDILPGMFDVEPLEFPVTVQEDKNNPGYYRIVNPWLMYPLAKVIKMMGGSLTVSDDITIEIDATDPGKVVIPMCNIGVDDGDGNVSIGSLLGLIDRVSGINPVQAIAFAGVLENNCISFEAPASILMIQGNSAYATNLTGKFSLVLPGGELPVDYSVELSRDMLLCHKDGNYDITVDADDRIGEIRYGLSNGVLSSYVDDVVENGMTCKPGDTVTMSVSGIEGSHIYAIFASMNEDGDWEDYDYMCLYTVGDCPDSWVDCGQAEMTEGLISSIYPKDCIEKESFLVDVQRHATIDGYYRLVEPYKRWSHIADKLTGHDHNHYLYINATDPDNVYFEPSVIGVNDPVRGEYAVKSQYSDRGDIYGFDVIKRRGEKSDGKLIDGVITFGVDCNVLIHATSENPDFWWYGAVNTNPDFDIEKYKTDPTYNVPRFVPGDFRLDLNALSAGIGSFDAENANADPVYYNLQGVEIGLPETGLYIVRRGNTVTKEFVK